MRKPTLKEESERGRNISYPLAMNFKNLLRYDFDKVSLDEVVFFEWLVVKRASMGRKIIWYQNQRVLSETGLKRTRLNTLKAKFIDEYGLIVGNQGLHNTTHYEISPVFIRSFVDSNVHPEHRRNLKDRLVSLKFGQGDLKLSNKEKSYVEDLYSSLNTIYNQRRTIYSEQKGNRIFGYTVLPKNNKSMEGMKRLLERYEKQHIENAFTAFADYHLDRMDSSSHMLNNFVSYKRERDSFPVFENYLNIFNLNYGWDE
ncbi:hypothetical protein [Robertkochia solimangrovi]|uniref:hypothetical protein n=1 Tax=Robertkochia solimangrovi TaxID=2213046 RepID=UPI0011808411|nr:hypothetical protein [Robertkochia solimangrovi]TRZ41677.1 hypothetical protein DMZ48_16860 [Robertkochia solimangrovi]